MTIDAGMQRMLVHGAPADSLDALLDQPTGTPDEDPGDTMYLACPRAAAMFTEFETDIFVIQALSSLPLMERRVLDLLFAEELTVRQAGAVLGVDKVVVQRRRDSALSKLRSLL